MLLEIVTPEAVIFNSNVDSVSVPGINGEFQMLNNHAPIVSLLANGTIKINGSAIVIDEDFQDQFTKVDEVYTLSIAGGTIEMRDNRVIILAD
ncbi:MAG: F-type H+-transporting ATPase subunit epsilon [Porticoccaceae bacterium]|jgi:F-type H+-transporting ATPase subunit epsilon